MLEAHGMSPPAWDRHVPADLRTDDLPAALARAGHDPGQPSLVPAEGLTFFLPAATTHALLSPACLGLAPGSRLVFDCWSNERVDGLNRRMRERLGAPMFQRFPWPAEPASLPRELATLGYARVSVTPVEQLLQSAPGAGVRDEFSCSWLIVEARCQASEEFRGQ